MPKLTCTACKESVPVLAMKGTVDNITFEHENWCPYLKAVESSRTTAMRWIEKNGNPMVVEQD